MFAETTWPDVGMTFVQQVLVPLIAIAGSAAVYWFKLRDVATKTDRAAEAAKAAAVTSGEAVKVSKVNTELASKLQQSVDENTQITKEAASANEDKLVVIHTLVNGERAAERASLMARIKELEESHAARGVLNPGETISSRLQVVHDDLLRRVDEEAKKNDVLRAEIERLKHP